VAERQRSYGVALSKAGPGIFSDSVGLAQIDRAWAWLCGKCGPGIYAGAPRFREKFATDLLLTGGCAVGAVPARFGRFGPARTGIA
jgi:hypothetical protein